MKNGNYMRCISDSLFEEPIGNPIKMNDIELSLFFNSFYLLWQSKPELECFERNSWVYRNPVNLNVCILIFSGAGLLITGVKITIW